MCEPVTIAATCLGVVNHIWTLSNKIRNFVLLVREARADMLGLTSELSTLSLSISMLQDDCTKIPFPESVLGDLSANLEDVLKKCENTTKEMIEVLDLYMSADFLPKLRWAVNGRDRINKLKHDIESCKPAIGFALMVGQIILLKSIKNDTVIIREDTTTIKKDTTLIPGVKDDTTTIIKLLTDKLNLSEQLTDKQFVMQRFYDEMTTTAESVVDEMEAASWPSAALKRKNSNASDQKEVEQGEKGVEGQKAKAEDGKGTAKEIGEGDETSPKRNSEIALIETQDGLAEEESNSTDTAEVIPGSEPGAHGKEKASVDLGVLRVKPIDEKQVNIEFLISKEEAEVRAGESDKKLRSLQQNSREYMEKVEALERNVDVNQSHVVLIPTDVGSLVRHPNNLEHSVKNLENLEKQNTVIEEGQSMEINHKDEGLQTPEPELEESRDDHTYSQAPQLPELSLEGMEPLEDFGNFWQIDPSVELVSTSKMQQSSAGQIYAKKDKELEKLERLKDTDELDILEADISTRSSIEKPESMNIDNRHVAAPELPNPALNALQLNETDKEIQGGSKLPQQGNSTEEPLQGPDLPQDEVLVDNQPNELNKDVMVEAAGDVLRVPIITLDSLLEEALWEIDKSTPMKQQISKIEDLLKSGAGPRFGTYGRHGILVGLNGALEAEVQGAKRPEIVKMLLAWGAKANSHEMLIITAIQDHRLDIAEILLKNGAAFPQAYPVSLIELLEVKNEKIRKRWLQFILNHFAIDSAMIDEATRKAVEIGDAVILDILLAHSKRVNVRDQENMSLCWQAVNTGREEILQTILHYKPAPSPTALLCAARNGNVRMVEDLLNYGVDVNCRTSPQNLTALHRACSEGHPDVVKILLERGAKTSAKLKDGETPMQAAQKRLDNLKGILSGKLPNSSAISMVKAYEEIIVLLKQAGSRRKSRFWTKS